MYGHPFMAADGAAVAEASGAFDPSGATDAAGVWLAPEPHADTIRPAIATMAKPRRNPSFMTPPSLARTALRTRRRRSRDILQV